MKKKSAQSKAKGFTLIELLVVFSVTSILSAIGIASFVNYSRQQTLSQATSALKNHLRFAQGKALVQEIPASCTTLSAYELKFSQDGSSYTIYPVCSGFPGVTIVSTTFNSKVKKTSGPDTTTFKILTGAVNGAGTIILSAYGLNRTIDVTSVGVIK